MSAAVRPLAKRARRSPASREAAATVPPGAWQHLQRGLGLALVDIARGRDDLRAALALFGAQGNAEGEQGRLIAAAALVQFIGIADDDYAGFQSAVDAVAATSSGLEHITDPDHRLLALSGALVAGWFRALDDPKLRLQAEAIGCELGNEAVSAPVRCCAGLTVLAYFEAQFDHEKTLWLELAMRQSLDSPAVSVRLSAEWHHALAQSLYQWEPARAEALRALHSAATLRVPEIELKQALLEAQIAIGEGRLAPGHAALARAEPMLNLRAPRLAAWWHLLRSRLDLIEGRHRQAITHARLSVRLATQCQFPERWMGVAIMQEGQVQMADGAYLNAVPFFERAGHAASGSQADFCWCLAHFARALGHFNGTSDPGLALAELQRGLALAQRLHWLNFFRPCPRAAAEVCALGLEHQIETAFVREVIAARGLDAVRPDLSVWPWPIRVLTLGRFQIELDGKLLAFGRKVARKPLELLQFIVASGGSDVSAASAMFALWRDLEGDKARSAFNVALHRLRKLLGNDDAVVLELGRASLNPRLVWVDCLAFEQLVDGAAATSSTQLAPQAALATQRALAIYGGHFLHDTEDASWQMVYRSRLASKFKRTVTQLACHGVANGDMPAVRTLLERALELDPLAEDLARELMRLLSDGGEQAAALNVFEQCKAALAQGLGAKPSAATLELAARIRAMR